MKAIIRAYVIGVPVGKRVLYAGENGALYPKPNDAKYYTDKAFAETLASESKQWNASVESALIRIEADELASLLALEYTIRSWDWSHKYSYPHYGDMPKVISFLDNFQFTSLHCMFAVIDYIYKVELGNGAFTFDDIIDYYAFDVASRVTNWPYEDITFTLK